MYLLNLLGLVFFICYALFTFHYVSIKSVTHLYNDGSITTFTFHYVSIKSAMIHIPRILLFVFTFHYVSIKSHLMKSNS